jgi:hypothetical protein
MSTTFVFDGLAVIEAHVTPESTVECRPDGLALRHPPSGFATFIPTDRPPEPGGKVTALRSLQSIFDSPLLVRREVGGGAVRAGVDLARRLCANHAGGAVHLFNSGAPLPELDDLCAQTGLICHSLARQAAPVNLIVPAHGRIIIKGQNDLAPGRLDDRQRAVVGRVSADATAVASVSSKDAALTAATIGTGNGARRYFQPTGSLSPEMTHLLLLTAHEVVCNFEEWMSLGRDVGLAVADVPEESPQAPEAASALLRALHRRGWAGAEAAVCTLGRRGLVAADWRNDTLFHMRFEMTDGSPGVPTPPGAGDLFLAEWLFLRETWSLQGHLRHPIAANAVRTIHAVAPALGLRRDRYAVCPRPC